MPPKRDAEGDDTLKMRRRHCDHEGRDQSDPVISQRMLAATTTLEATNGISPGACQCFDFNLGMLIPKHLPPEL